MIKNHKPVSQRFKGQKLFAEILESSRKERNLSSLGLGRFIRDKTGYDLSDRSIRNYERCKYVPEPENLKLIALSGIMVHPQSKRQLSLEELEQILLTGILEDEVMDNSDRSSNNQSPNFWSPSSKQRIRLANWLKKSMEKQTIDIAAAAKKSNMTELRIQQVLSPTETVPVDADLLPRLSLLLSRIGGWEGDEPIIDRKRNYKNNLSLLLEHLDMD